MRYMSTDCLCDFEFHDAEFLLKFFVNDELTVSVKHLNIHKNTPQNLFDVDMEISEAQLTFKGFSIVSYEPGLAWKKDSSDGFCSNEPHIVYYAKEALDRLIVQLKKGLCILDFDTLDDKVYFIDGMAEAPFFTVCFTFDRVVIEWDDYRQQSWYTYKKCP